MYSGKGSIILKTEGGWSHQVSLDDSLFVDILAPFNELDENVDEVTLTGSVATALESSWDKMERLMKLTEAGAETVLESYLQKDESRLRAKPAFLYEVELLASILSPPPIWPLFTPIDRERSRTRRLHHYQRLGRLLEEVGSMLLVADCSEASLDFIEGILQDAKTDSEIRSMVRGMVWNAILESLAVHSPKRMLLLALDWEPLILALGEGHELVREVDRYRVMIGEVTPIGNGNIFGKVAKLYMDDRIPQGEVEQLYTAIVRTEYKYWQICYTGLMRLLTGYCRNHDQFAGFIGAVHSRLIERVCEGTEIVDEEYIPACIEALADGVGLLGLRFIKARLEKEMRWDGIRRELAMMTIKWKMAEYA